MKSKWWEKKAEDLQRATDANGMKTLYSIHRDLRTTEKRNRTTYCPRWCDNTKGGGHPESFCSALQSVVKCAGRGGSDSQGCLLDLNNKNQKIINSFKAISKIT